MSELRKAFSEIVDRLDEADTFSDLLGLVDWAAEKGQQALAAEPEMEKLFKQLTNPIYQIIDEYGGQWFTIERESLVEIFAEFGYEEGEGERKDARD